MKGFISSMISYTTHVSTMRDEKNIPELDAGIPQTSTATEGA